MLLQRLPLDIHYLSSHCMQSIVHGVMSDDVAQILNCPHHYSVVGLTWFISAENIGKVIEMAKGESHLADLHPMRVLFIIPQKILLRLHMLKLDENFSRPVKEFVSLCFTKVPAEENDKAEALEDEMVVKEHEVEKKQKLQPEFQKQKERKQKALKEKEMDNAAYN
ncbi:hypothetical protein F2Q69_00014101 [Brassica cretica]|uniref:Uncharacterized protein n=1 Tax=Brassica cretica TaxID=69181 RepID=A0A8S9R9G9_BRACR|nr:hypothetical protein F2Q69_00014101 [Brassica cretica]